LTTRFLLNGVQTESNVDPSMPLIYFLRNEQGLKGTRFGCGGEDCGACTLLLDGALKFSCTLLVSDVAGKAIETVEGLHGELAESLRKELAAGGATQCGYCLSGIFVTAYELLRRDSNPTREEVQAALSRSLCRCGAHASILRAIARSIDALASNRASS
jgi:nicotinate dehydrogenase subunit A